MLDFHRGTCVSVSSSHVGKRTTKKTKLDHSLLVVVLRVSYHGDVLEMPCSAWYLATSAS
jgi:hypothetical protein